MCLVRPSAWSVLCPVRVWICSVGLDPVRPYLGPSPGVRVDTDDFIVMPTYICVHEHAYSLRLIKACDTYSTIECRV